MRVTLTGPNDYLRQASLQRYISTFLSKNDSMALEKIDAEEVGYERITEAIDSLPFLSPRKMVILLRPSFHKAFIENVDSLLADESDWLDLIIVEPKLDKRLAYYKTLQKLTKFEEYADLDETALQRWVQSYVTDQKGNITAQDARYLITRVGMNQLILSHELDKLLLFTKDVSRKTIDDLIETTPQSSIFDLIDAALAHDHQKALALYKEQRALKVEPQQIIAMLAWQLQVLAIMKAAGERSLTTIASEARINPYVLRKNADLVKRLSMSQIRGMIADAVQLDTRLKTQTIDADEALQLYLITLP